jgi:hypothetical protein
MITTICIRRIWHLLEEEQIKYWEKKVHMFSTSAPYIQNKNKNIIFKFQKIMNINLDTINDVTYKHVNFNTKLFVLQAT